MHFQTGTDSWTGLYRSLADFGEISSNIRIQAFCIYGFLFFAISSFLKVRNDCLWLT